MLKPLGVFAFAAFLAVSNMAYAGEQLLIKHLKHQDAYLKWGEPKLGTGAEIRYYFLTESADFGEWRNCGAMTPISTMLSKQGISFTEFEQETKRAFARWERVANVRFTRVATQEEADLLIGSQQTPLPNDLAWANVLRTKLEEAETGSITKSAICLNPKPTRPGHATRWLIGEGENCEWLEYVMAHEIGHVLGLDHPGPPTGTLMTYRCSADPELTSSDIKAAQFLYGPSGYVHIPEKTPAPQ